MKDQLNGKNCFDKWLEFYFSVNSVTMWMGRTVSLFISDFYCNLDK